MSGGFKKKKDLGGPSMLKALEKESGRTELHYRYHIDGQMFHIVTRQQERPCRPGRLDIHRIVDGSGGLCTGRVRGAGLGRARLARLRRCPARARPELGGAVAALPQRRQRAARLDGE